MVHNAATLLQHVEFAHLFAFFNSHKTGTELKYILIHISDLLIILLAVRSESITHYTWTSLPLDTCALAGQSSTVSK